MNSQLRKEFSKYVIPSMIAFAFSGLYAIVDGWFIGNCIGEAGLSSINVAYPMTALVQAIGTGVGMGGAVLISISAGRTLMDGNEKNQQEYLGNTLLLLLITSIISMASLGILAPTILNLFGATGEIFNLANIYIKYIILGAAFQIFGTGLVPIVRNYDGAFIAMCSMVLGFVTNVVLDAVFIMEMNLGMKGAALATVIGQGMAIIPSFIYLMKKQKLWGYAKISKVKIKTVEILKVAASPFGLTFLPSVILIIINKTAMIQGGNDAIACYAVVSYVIYVTQMLLQGVGDGVQPLISRYFGLGDLNAVKHLRNLAFKTATAVAVLSAVIMTAFAKEIAYFFGVEENVAQMVEIALPIFTAGFIFTGIARVITSYFYATETNTYAYILIYSEAVGIAVLAAYILTEMLNLGLLGVWLAPPITQVFLAILGIALLKRLNKNS